MGDHKNSKSQTSRFMHFDSLLCSAEIRRHLADSTCNGFFPVSTILSYAFKWYSTCNLDIPFPPRLLVVRRIFPHFMFSLSNTVLGRYKARQMNIKQSYKAESWLPTCTLIAEFLEHLTCTLQLPAKFVLSIKSVSLINSDLYDLL
jgi:hypothetical protein